MQLSDFGLIPHECSTVKPGDKFGRLRVILTGKIEGSYRYKALCQCDCGSQVKAYRIDGLTSGAIEGCGCVRIERTKTHGMTSHRLFNRWKNMIDRCENQKSKAYKNYGGRGISVCDRWKDVASFIEDMDPSFSDGLELDRKDNSKGYCPENCHWVKPIDNNRNRRSTIKVVIDGNWMTLKEASAIMGIDYKLAWSRIYESGWPIEKAIDTPPINATERMAMARKATKRGF